MLSFLFQIIKGIFICAGAILPGISSGVFCVIFGIYEKLLNAIIGFFSNVKENIKFLFPILVGIAFGVFLFGNILNYLFNKVLYACASLHLLFKTAAKLVFLFELRKRLHKFL